MNWYQIRMPGAPFAAVLGLLLLAAAPVVAQEPAAEQPADEATPEGDAVEEAVSEESEPEVVDEAGDSATGDAETEPEVIKVPRWYLETALRIRVNPLGLTLYADAGYRIPLYEKRNPLLDLAQIDISATSQLSPAYVWAGPQLEITPLSILVLRGTVQGLYYFGTFGYLYEYGGLDADWSPDRQQQVADDGLGQAVGGYLAEAAVTLQAAAFGFVVRVITTYTWVWMNVDDAYVEPYFDLLLAPDDAVWVTTSILGYTPTSYLMIGGLWEHTRSRETDITRDLVGLLVLWSIQPHIWEWGQPEVAALLGLYARDPYRQKEPMFGMELSLRF